MLHFTNNPACGAGWLSALKGKINLGNVKAKQSKSHHYGGQGGSPVSWCTYGALVFVICHFLFLSCTLGYAALWQPVTAILPLRSQTSQYERLKYKRKQTSLQSFNLRQRKTQAEAVMEQLSEGTGSCIALIEL